MADIDVNLPGLDAIASLLRTASTTLDGGTAPPDAPQAGDATADLAGALARLMGSLDAAVTGLAAAGDAVAESRSKFQEAETTQHDTLADLLPW